MPKSLRSHAPPSQPAALRGLRAQGVVGPKTSVQETISGYCTAHVTITDDHMF